LAATVASGLLQIPVWHMPPWTAHDCVAPGTLDDEFITNTAKMTNTNNPMAAIIMTFMLNSTPFLPIINTSRIRINIHKQISIP
jgi:hypothetical protein